MMVNRLHQRFAALPTGSPADDLRLREGSRGDYKALAGFHYLRNEPFSMERVLVLEDVRATAAGRFARRGMERRVVGVLIESLPALSCVLRDEALGGRYRDLPRGDAARLMNGELRCISRVVVHPQWRGLGLAVRLVRHALATATTVYTEALAAMGRVHPFFELAGMGAYRRWPLAKDQRLRDALTYAGLEVWEMADARRVMDWVEGEGRGSAKPQAAVVRRELRRWAGGGLTLREQIELARDRLLCEPVYYLRKNDQ